MAGRMKFSFPIVSPSLGGFAWACSHAGGRLSRRRDGKSPDTHIFQASAYITHDIIPQVKAGHSQFQILWVAKSILFLDERNSKVTSQKGMHASGMGRICGHFSVCHSYKRVEKNVHLEFYYIFPLILALWIRTRRQWNGQKAHAK